LILNSLTEGMGINAVCRIFNVGKNTIYRWQLRFNNIKETLLLYSLCHQFVVQMVEGDEVYTKVNKNMDPCESEGWTIILMERMSRFIWVMNCGGKDEYLFKNAIEILCEVMEQTSDLSLLTDGERRYGKLLFEICHELLKTGKPGRPSHVLPEGLKVRVKNKGEQSHKKGPKRPKYEAPQKEHPVTSQDLKNQDIHANHVEAFNASLRRKCSAYRRKTNTYAKKKNRLQERLDVLWIVHNFIRSHFTTKKVPAVALGIIENGLSFLELFNLKISC
jgi:hypothetical protein